MMPADEQANVCHFGRHLVYNLNDDALTVQDASTQLQHTAGLERSAANVPVPPLPSASPHLDD